MDNNFMCSWLLFYSKPTRNSEGIYSLIEVESDIQLKKHLCSSIPYIEAGKNLDFDHFPDSCGFEFVFQYFSNHKGMIMEQLRDHEQQSFIKCLTNIDSFSMKHHISIIKCYMKAYVCQLTPLIRIRRAFLTMGCPSPFSFEEESFRNIQKILPVWLSSSAVKGYQKLMRKSKQSVPEIELAKFINQTSFTSQLVYCMCYYAQTKMMQFSIPVHELNVVMANETKNKDMAVVHGNIVMKAFSQICDNGDVFPLEASKLNSMPMDNVQVTLTIALVFHWIFGRSFKALENLLKQSSAEGSINNASKFQNEKTDIYINSNTQKLEEAKPMKAFFKATRPSGIDGLNQIFSSKEATTEKNLLNIVNNEGKANIDGESSPDVYLTPTEEVIPTTFSVSPLNQNSKLLSQKSILHNPPRNLPLVSKETSDSMTISLKAEFEKKQQQKLNMQKSSKVKLIPVNETTWLAQKNKNDVTQIPLTPKKSTKSSVQSPTQLDSQSLTKGQINEIQIQLGLQRQKIQNNKKKTAEKTEKNIEGCKQKTFFQVINKKQVPQRAHSLELSVDLKSLNNGHTSDKRKTIAIPHEENKIDIWALTGKASDNHQILVSHNENASNNNNDNINNGKTNNNLPEKTLYKDQDEEHNKGIELPQSLQESDVALSPVHIAQDQQQTDSLSYHLYPMHHSALNNVNEMSFLEEPPVSRKNSSTSISSLSSASSKNTDRILLNQEEYYKSIDILNRSLTSLQEEIRILSKQQSSWSQQINPVLQTKSMILDNNSNIYNNNINNNNNAMENHSIPETPTNNVVSLTEISNVAKSEKEEGREKEIDREMKREREKEKEREREKEKEREREKEKELEKEIEMEREKEINIKKEYFPSNITTIPSSLLPIIPENMSLQNSNSIIQEEATVKIIDSSASENLKDVDHSTVGKQNFSVPYNNVSPILNSKQMRATVNHHDDYKNEKNRNIDNKDNKSVMNTSGTDEEMEEMTSSTDSSIVSANTHPITFAITTTPEIEEAQRRKAEILARREEKRRLKIELLKQKRDEERETNLSATIDFLMEQEERKRLENEKRDALLQKYLERKKYESTAAYITAYNSGLVEHRSSSAVNTPVKLRVSCKTSRPVAVSGKQESMTSLPLANLQKNQWFSSMRITKKNTSQSTSKLNDDMALIDSNKFGVPLPPQEYNGPKLFGKRKVKTNRSVIVNAISHCCLAGSVNETLKESVLRELADAEGTHFMILFRDARCQYRALYSFNLATDELNLICGSGPKKISHEMVEKFYKYNSGAKQFNIIISTKHLSPAVDAICIQSIHWNSARPASQILQNSLSITNIIQSKPKRNAKNFQMST